MLITRITPNVIARPRAVRMRMELKLRLLLIAALRSVAFIRRESPEKDGWIAGCFCGADLQSASSTSRRGRPITNRPHLSSQPNRRVSSRPDLDLLALLQSVLGPVHAPARERDLRVGVRGDQVGRMHHVELLVLAGLAHQEALVGVLVARVEL